MQNTFPYILSFGLLSPFILRIVAGSYFSYFGYKGLTTEWLERFDFFEKNRIRPSMFFATATATIDLTLGLLLIMGFETQIITIVLAIVCLTVMAVKKEGGLFPTRDYHLYFLLFIILISLFISGAGFFAMDLSL